MERKRIERTSEIFSTQNEKFEYIAVFVVVVVVNSAASIIQSHPLTDFSHLLQSHSFSFTTPQKKLLTNTKRHAERSPLTGTHTVATMSRKISLAGFESNPAACVSAFHISPAPAFSAAGFTEHGRVYSTSSSSGRASFIQLDPSLLLYGRCQIKLLCTLEKNHHPGRQRRNKLFFFFFFFENHS